MTHALVALALTTLLGADDARPAPIAVFLEPVTGGAVQGVAVEKVEAALRARLGREKGLALVTEADQATVVLRVTECLAWAEKTHVTEITDRTPNLPTAGRGRGVGPEAYGSRTEHRPQVSLVVRATWPERFHDLQSGDGDRTLKDAADSVGDQLARVLKAPRRPR